MTRLTIVSPVYGIPASPHLIVSCRELELNLHLYGMGKPWTNLFQGKIVDLSREIEGIDTEYVLVSDASDAFFLSDADEILNKFSSMGCSVAVSGEKNCWPEIYLKQFYPQCSSPWHYVNSGGYIGSKESLLKLLHIMQSFNTNMLPFQSQRDWDNDQFRLSLAYLTDMSSVGLTIGVDVNCNIFQAMHSTEMHWGGNRAVNPKSGNQPCHLHFNGNWPGIQEAFNRRFGCSEQAITA